MGLLLVRSYNSPGVIRAENNFLRVFILNFRTFNELCSTLPLTGATIGTSGVKSDSDESN